MKDPYISDIIACMLYAIESNNNIFLTKDTPTTLNDLQSNLETVKTRIEEMREKENQYKSMPVILCYLTKNIEFQSIYKKLEEIKTKLTELIYKEIKDASENPYKMIELVLNKELYTPTSITKELFKTLEETRKLKLKLIKLQAASYESQTYKNQYDIMIKKIDAIYKNTKAIDVKGIKKNIIQLVKDQGIKEEDILKFFKCDSYEKNIEEYKNKHGLNENKWMEVVKDMTPNIISLMMLRIESDNIYVPYFYIKYNHLKLFKHPDYGLSSDDKIRNIPQASLNILIRIVKLIAHIFIKDKKNIQLKED